MNSSGSGGKIAFALPESGAILDSSGRVRLSTLIYDGRLLSFDMAYTNNRVDPQQYLHPGLCLGKRVTSRNTHVQAQLDQQDNPVTKPLKERHRSFNPSTHNFHTIYDGKGLGSVPNYSNGKTTRAATSVSETRYTSFDVMGNLLASQQITESTTYTSGYTYNLSGGIKSDETAPGYKNTLIEPQPKDGFTFVRTSHDTMYGKVAAAWELTGNRFELTVDVPVNAFATVRLPNAKLGAVEESGQTLSKQPGVLESRQVGDNVVVKIGSGRYRFAYGMN